ncbi:hypothetical protein SteCoe_32854 [Stentor coeruleus]|uniref:Uncharacterized protein n=1 Tax=Stentor coeruleus TaxID=5963 RepID=A0A1R2AY15_9CILI|nr:hypothetical protein SteCoe_32854 [Stentor coeruleus]
MQSNLSSLTQFSIPNSPEIIAIRQFQDPSLYKTIGILILKLLARFRRNKNIVNHLHNALKIFQKEINENIPSNIAYTNYFIKLADYIVAMDNETNAFFHINEGLNNSQFLACIELAIKGLLSTLTKEKNLIPDFNDTKDFEINNSTLFTALMNKFGIATKLYYINTQPETFYPARMSTYPLMHILFNQSENNGIVTKSYYEVYTDELFKIESNNNITANELEAYPFSYSNKESRFLSQSLTIQKPILQVTIPASLLDDLLNEIMRVNNNTMPSQIYQMMKPFADNSKTILNLASFRRATLQKNSDTFYACNICGFDRETSFFLYDKCKNCKVCKNCRKLSLDQCKACFRYYDDSEKFIFNNSQ